MSDRTAPRYKTTEWRGRKNYECTLCPFAVLEDRGAMVRHANERHPLPSQVEEPLLGFEGIDFASDEAAELANTLAARGLTPGVLQRSTPSGKGGYTVADVRAAAGTLNKE